MTFTEFLLRHYIKLTVINYSQVSFTHICNVTHLASATSAMARVVFFLPHPKVGTNFGRPVTKSPQALKWLVDFRPDGRPCTFEIKLVNFDIPKRCFLYVIEINLGSQKGFNR